MEAWAVPETVAAPLEAYRFWPSGEAITYGEGKKTVRFIFYRVRFSDYEEEQLSQFERYMRNNYPDFVYPDWLVKEERIRVLLGCKFDLKKSADAIFASIEWRHTQAPRSFYSLYEHCQGVLQSGAIYIHGRDHRYRPLLVLNVERMNLREHPVGEYRALICFLLEFTSKTMMIPGQVENWVVITDLCRTSLFDLPISELKSLIKLLQDNFRCRMTVNYIVNAPTSITFAWRIIKVAIEEHTLRKIKIMKTAHAPELRSHFAPHQYEEKYGGTAPNATLFWPPVMPSGPYHAENEDPEAHLSPHSSFLEYFPLPRNSAISTGVQDTVLTVDNKGEIIEPAEEPMVEEDPEERYSDRFRVNFVRIPMIKQETDDVPDPDVASEYQSIRPVSQRKPTPRGCCMRCRQGKCSLS